MVPLNIFTFDVGANRKTNHILIENSSLFVSDYALTDVINSAATFTSNSNTLAVTNADLDFTSANS